MKLTTRSFAFGLAVSGLVLAACPSAPSVSGNRGAAAIRGGAGDRVLSFSDIETARAVAEWKKHIYLATPSTVYRFKKEDGALVDELAGPAGKLAGVKAMAADAQGLWVSTEKTLHRFTGTTWEVPPAGGPPRFGSLLQSGEGLLVGTVAGLWRLKGDLWRQMLPGARISALITGRATPGVWVGTGGEGVYQLINGKLKPHSPAGGQPVRDVLTIGQTPLGGVLVLGRDVHKRKVLAFFDGQHWTTYWITSPHTLRWMLSVGGKVVIGHDSGVYQLQVITDEKRKGSAPTSLLAFAAQVSPLAPDGYPMAKLVATSTGHWWPADIVRVHQGPSFGYVCTKQLGVARYDGSGFRWYRTKRLLRDEERLKVACAKKECYLAASGRAFYFDGKRFAPLHLGNATTRAEAFVDDGAGGILAMHAPADKSVLLISQLKNGRFVQKHALSLPVPHGQARVRFVRRAPNGQLWIGLRYLDDQQELRPWGLISVTQQGKHLFHRSSLLPGETRPGGSLALPDDIRDAFFDGGELWLATGSGIVHVKGKKTREITENEGLNSEIIYMMAKSTKGEVLAASYAGLGRFDGKHWLFDYPKPAGAGARAVVVHGKDLWVATYGGLARLTEGKNRRVYHVADGLAHERVYDVYLGPGRRVWALTAGGLSIISLGGTK